MTNPFDQIFNMWTQQDSDQYNRPGDGDGPGNVRLRCKCGDTIVRSRLHPDWRWVHEGDVITILHGRVTTTSQYDHEADPDVIDVGPSAPPRTPPSVPPAPANPFGAVRFRMPGT